MYGFYIGLAWFLIGFIVGAVCKHLDGTINE